MYFDAFSFILTFFVFFLFFKSSFSLKVIQKFPYSPMGKKFWKIYDPSSLNIFQAILWIHFLLWVDIIWITNSPVSILHICSLFILSVFSLEVKVAHIHATKILKLNFYSRQMTEVKRIFNKNFFLFIKVFFLFVIKIINSVDWLDFVFYNFNWSLVSSRKLFYHTINKWNAKKMFLTYCF